MVAAPEPPAPLATPARIEALFAALAAQNPNPTTELHYGNGFQLLVAVMLSAQTTDVAVNKATARFFGPITTAARLVEWGEENLRAHIQSLNFYRTKAAHVYKMATLLVAQHGGDVPHSMEALQKLPGVGVKTASVVANTLWGEPVVAVDTHVFRVARRLGLSHAPTPEAVAAGLPARIPPAYLKNAHHWLILHGRYTCTARTPKCATCPVGKMCHSSVKAKINL